jgi:hypothetical protein
MKKKNSMGELFRPRVKNLNDKFIEGEFFIPLKSRG